MTKDVSGEGRHQETIPDRECQANILPILIAVGSAMLAIRMDRVHIHRENVLIRTTETTSIKALQTLIKSNLDMRTTVVDGSGMVRSRKNVPIKVTTDGH